VEGHDLLVHELLRGRLREELVGRREEKSLERSGLPVAGKLARKLRAACEACVLRRAELRIHVAPLLRDLVDRADALGHLLDREALGEDDLERLGRRDNRRRRRGRGLSKRPERKRAKQAHAAERSEQAGECERPPGTQLPAARARAPARRWGYLLAHAR
jgi:hypothetical protein